MGKIANIHSLLATPWMLTSEYSQGLQLYLLSILGLGDAPAMEDAFAISYMGRNEMGAITIAENSRANSVAVVSIKQPILKYSQSCGPKGTKEMQQEIQSLVANPNVLGIILDIDSGGGQVTGTPEFAAYIDNIEKPVVTYTDGNIVSAAYYIGAAADYIIANEHAFKIGSAGTYISTIEIKGIIEKMGGKVHETYASKSTKKNIEFRDLADGKTELMIKDNLDPITDKFHKEIFAFRPQLSKEVETGIAVFPEKALELGLIDSIGTMSDAINKVIELSEENTNSTNMETKQYPFITATLGLDEIKTASNSIFGGKKGIFLTEEQLNALETKTSDLSTAAQANQDRDSNAATIHTAIEAAAKTAGVEADTDTARIEAITALAVKFNAADGDDPTKIKVDADPIAGDSTDLAFMNQIVNA